MIRLDNVSKFFRTPSGRHYVLRNANLEIPSGAKVGVIGRNGAGKSTLMRLLSGVDVPNSGHIVRKGSISWPMGLASGFQVAMTGRENTRFACRIQGVPDAEIPEILESVKEFSGIGKYFDMPTRTYSSGMKARLNFAIAMSFDFDCYIIDELTAVGDQAFREKSRKIFEEKRKNASFIKVSHNMGELLRECETGMLLEDANLQIFPTMKEAVDRYKELTRDKAGKKSTPKKNAAKKMSNNKPALKPEAPKPPRMAPAPHIPAPMMPRQKRA